MSVEQDIESLQRTIAASSARKAELEAMTRASRLMRQAGEILLGLSSENARKAAEHLADACVVLAGPKAEGEV